MISGVPGLGSKIFSGTIWTVAMRVAIRFLGIISMIILARLLEPTDFGLVAKATMIQSFLFMITELGLEPALIRDQKSTKDHYNTVWTVHIIRGGIIGLFLAILAYPASVYLHEPRLQYIIYCYALVTFFEGFYNIGVVDFRKEMNFSYDFKYNLYKKVAGFIVTISVAIIWQTYWALVAGVFASLIVSLFASFAMSSFRPKVSLSEWRALIDFSKWYLGYEILVAVSSKIDLFILSRFSTTENVGFYTIATEVAATPSTEIAMPVSRAMLPGLSKLNHDIKQFSSMYLLVLSAVLMIAIPAATGVSFLSDKITLTLLGDKWLEAIPFIQILAFFGLSRVVNATAISALVAFNRPDILTKVAAIRTVLRVVILSGGLYFLGVIGMVWGVLIAGLVGLIIIMFIQSRLRILPFKELIALIWRIILATLVMVAGLYFLRDTILIDLEIHLFFSLFLEILVGAILYGVSLMLLWYFFSKGNGPENYILQKVFKNRWKMEKP